MSKSWTSQNQICKQAYPDNTPPLPRMTDLSAQFIGYFKDINVNESSSVETASLSPICASGDLVTISALAGVGKTTVGADLIIGAAHPGREGKALGGAFHFQIPTGKTIKCAILDAESTSNRWQSIIARKLEREGLDPSLLGCVRYLRASDFGIQSSSSREKNSRAIAEALVLDRCHFILVDTIGSTWASPNINDSEWVFRGLKPFREICQQYGITVVALTHTSRKPGNGPASVNPIGSSHQENQADAQLFMERIPGNGSDGIQITLRKSRRAFWIPQNSKIKLEFTPEYGFKPIGNYKDIWPHDWSDKPTSNEISDRSAKSKVIVFLKTNKHESMPAKEIANALGRSDRTIRKILSSLELDGFVTRFGGGRSTSWGLK